MPPPPRPATQKERAERAQLQWNSHQRIRRARLKFLTEKTTGPEGFDVIKQMGDYAAGEGNVERKLLAMSKGEVKRHIDAGKNSDRWFLGKNMLGEDSPRDAIGLLGLLATANVGDKFIESYFKDTNQDSAWLFRNQFEGHPADYPPWTTQTDDTSSKLRHFHTMVDALAKDPDSLPLWKHLNAMFRLTGYLTEILRFIDVRNAHLRGQVALPDGSNIEDASLKASWVLHRAWIRLLHYRSLSFGSKARGIEQLKEILVIARAQLEEELRLVPASTRQIVKSLLQFETTLGSLNLFLEALATKFGQYSVPNPGAKRPYKVSDFDIDADRVGALWSQITQHQRPDPLGQAINPLGPMLLWSQLLDRAAEFEEKNSRYYVEDHLFENRVIAEDEHWETVQQIISQYYAPDVIKDRNPDAVKQEYVKALARKVSQVNTHRRNFLMLRDWSKKRPWKQLYWVFDTVTTDSWREHIEDFYNTIEGLKAAPLNTLDGKEDNASEFITRVEADPESEPNLFANVFPIHPIPSHDPDKYVGPYFGNCVYCLEDYKPGELWLRFFCDHFVHYDCGRNAWDNPGNPDFRCPLCRHVQSWQLHQVAGIVPEAIDLWDNNDLVDAAELAAHPIVQMEGTPWDDGEGFRELYWSSEAQHLNNSENWDPEIPRSLHDEMAQMRDARRKRVIRARKERMERNEDYASLEDSQILSLHSESWH
ncbi:hypothetical protein MFRU_001g00130 [Monilinia fructicola]|nr:hypothetical protein MFRU_001g00130 [Monilinia fructicola]